VPLPAHRRCISPSVIPSASPSSSPRLIAHGCTELVASSGPSASPSAGPSASLCPGMPCLSGVAVLYLVASGKDLSGSPSAVPSSSLVRFPALLVQLSSSPSAGPERSEFRSSAGPCGSSAGPVLCLAPARAHSDRVPGGSPGAARVPCWRCSQLRPSICPALVELRPEVLIPVSPASPSLEPSSSPSASPKHRS
jgi:hypothetical protein